MLDGKGETRVLYITAEGVTLSGLTITGGYHSGVRPAGPCLPLREAGPSRGLFCAAQQPSPCVPRRMTATVEGGSTSTVVVAMPA